MIAAAGEELELDAEALASLRDALSRHRQRFEVTEDLGDERFMVRLRLPGEVETHNGDLHEDGTLECRFDGEALRDRTHTLIATSVLREQP